MPPLSTLLALSAYLILDGNWYAIDTREPISYETDLRTLVIEQTTAHHCTSASHSTAGGNGQRLAYGNSLQQVDVTGVRIFRKHYLGIEVSSAAGDMVCAGQVSGEPIFEGHFEG